MAKEKKKKSDTTELEDRIVSRLAQLLKLNEQPGELHGDVEVRIDGKVVACAETTTLISNPNIDLLIALAHPLRLEMCRLASKGPVRVHTFIEELQLGTTGQAYHHVKILEKAGWLVNSPHGWSLPLDRYTTLLGILALVKE